jgi:ADP-sugar diphosphatase
MFGASNVGFVNMRAITLEDGKPLPSYVFLRGNAVAILLLVNGKILLVRQYRVPLQKYCLEAPAGMIDEDGDFTGVAAKEIHEETGIKLTNKELVPLGSYHPSGGGCDEELLMFLADIKVSNEDLEVILNKIHGEGDH